MRNKFYQGSDEGIPREALPELYNEYPGYHKFQSQRLWLEFARQSLPVVNLQEPEYHTMKIQIRAKIVLKLVMEDFKVSKVFRHLIVISIPYENSYWDTGLLGVDVCQLSSHQCHIDTLQSLVVQEIMVQHAYHKTAVVDDFFRRNLQN